MTLPLSDPMVAGLMVELVQCVRAELARAHRGPVCRASIRHSVVTPAMDGCDCECDDGQGDAWVRLVRLDPEVGNDDSVVRPGACPTGWLAVIEMGVYRCIPMPEEGEALSEEAEHQISLDALSDMAALLRVLRCCKALADEFVGVDYWLPLGPAGGCAGGALQFRISITGGPGGC